MTQLIKQARRRRAPSNIGLGEDVGHDSSWFFRFEYPMLIVGGHGWLRFVESPVLQCEGPGAPEGSWYPRCPKARHLHPTDEDLSVGAPAWGTQSCGRGYKMHWVRGIPGAQVLGSWGTRSCGRGYKMHLDRGIPGAQVRGTWGTRSCGRGYKMHRDRGIPGAQVRGTWGTRSCGR